MMSGGFKLLLCREGNRTVVEYALNVTDKPMGVARYKLTQRPPKGLAEIKKAADKLGVVVDETFMESELTPKHAAARKSKEVSNG